MTDAARRLVISTLVMSAIAALLLFRPDIADRPATADVLTADQDLRWYRGNIHTHSLWSDGDDYPEMIALWYKEHDYDFLCFTDHNVLHTTERWTEPAKNKGKQRAYEKLKARFPDGWVDERNVDGRHEVRLKRFDEVFDKLAEPDKFLLIQGEEISDRFQNYPVHMNATNIQEAIPPLRGESVLETMQNNVNAVIAQRERTGEPILVHLNHPNFGYGVTAEELMRVRGENFFEVYNGHPGVRNSGDELHASTDRMWDIILTHRIAKLDLPLMYGLATDDGHSYHNIPSRASEPGRGWIEVLASELTPDALIAAIERGRFYASSGVKLKKIVSSKRGLEVDIEPEDGVTYKTEFIGTRRRFDDASRPVIDEKGQEVRTTRRYSEDIGAVLKQVEGTSAQYEFAGDELYVRAKITSSKQHPNPSVPGDMESAWVQPLRGPGAPIPGAANSP